jgi:hypothetical protein
MAVKSDDDVFGAVAALVMRGEHRDDIPGVPGAALEGAGCFEQLKDGSMRRMYTRGSADHLEAAQSGLTERLPPLVVADPRAVADAEAEIGSTFPPLLRRLLLEVGNGGFGPGYGILGVRDGQRDDQGYTAIDLYRRAHDASTGGWAFLPPSLLPICYWGCAIYSFIDCSAGDGPMWGWDPNPGPTDERALFPHEVTFAEWLDLWMAGRLYQPTLVHDDRSGVWRGATLEEVAAWMTEAEDEP